MKGLISVCVSMCVCKLATRVQVFAFVILLRHVCPHLYLKTWYEKVSLTFFFIPALAPFPRSKHGYSRIQVVMNTPKNTCLICIPLLGLAVCRPALAPWWWWWSWSCWWWWWLARARVMFRSGGRRALGAWGTPGGNEGARLPNIFTFPFPFQSHFSVIIHSYICHLISIIFPVSFHSYFSFTIHQIFVFSFLSYWLFPFHS